MHERVEYQERAVPARSSEKGTLENESEPLERDMGVGMFTSVSLWFIDKVAQLAEEVRSKGAAVAPAGTKGGEELLFRKLLDSLIDSKAEEKDEKKAPKVVHLLKNQPPLPSKVVERIREGSFIDFAFFPVFDDGPGEAGDWTLERAQPAGWLAGRRAPRKCLTWQGGARASRCSRWRGRPASRKCGFRWPPIERSFSNWRRDTSGPKSPAMIGGLDRRQQGRMT